MMEQGVSNLQRSFHSSCSWEKYIIHSSLAIKWSSAFSFLPVLCRTEKLFFFSFSFFCLLKTLLGTEPSAVTPHAEFGGLRDTLSPHHPIWAWETETNIWYELKISTRADGISGSRQQTERVQKTGQGMILPLQKILKSWNFDDAPQVGPSKTPAGTQTWCLCRFTSSTVIRVKSPFILCWSLRYCIL